MMAVRALASQTRLPTFSILGPGHVAQPGHGVEQPRGGALVQIDGAAQVAQASTVREAADRFQQGEGAHECLNRIGCHDYRSASTARHSRVMSSSLFLRS